MRRQSGDSGNCFFLEGNEAGESLISTVFCCQSADPKRHHRRLAISEASAEQLKGRHTISGLTYHRATRCPPARRRSALKQQLVIVARGSMIDLEVEADSRLQ
jgi:hypothetical protein